MKRLAFLTVLFVLHLSADDAPKAAAQSEIPPLSALDRMHEAEQHEELIELLRTALSGNGTGSGAEARTGRFRAELQWRLARALCNRAGLADPDTIGAEEARSMLDRAVSHADSAIELAPQLAQSYFWRGASSMLRARLRGRLAALFAASDGRDDIVRAIERGPDRTEYYYVLTQLYTQLPGFPVSFGDVDRAVSFGRKAVALHESALAASEVTKRYNGVYIELAKALWKRDLSAQARLAAAERKDERLRRADERLERAAAFEATIALGTRSDREEAIDLLEQVIERLSDVPNLDPRQRHSLENARNTLRQYRAER